MAQRMMIKVVSSYQTLLEWLNQQARVNHPNKKKRNNHHLPNLLKELRDNQSNKMKNFSKNKKKKESKGRLRKRERRESE